MVPNLALAYSSQGADGLAASGLGSSRASRRFSGARSRTRSTARCAPSCSTSTFLTASRRPGGETRGRPLARRQRLLRRPGTNQYDLEFTDFASITRTYARNHYPRFTVVTKTGRPATTVFRDDSRVHAARTIVDYPLSTPCREQPTGALWALDRVTDQCIGVIQLLNKAGAGHQEDETRRLAIAKTLGIAFNNQAQ